MTQRLMLIVIQVTIIMKKIQPIVRLICLFVGDWHLAKEIRIRLSMLWLTNIGTYRSTTPVNLFAWNVLFIGVFYKLAWGDFEAIMLQMSFMKEGAMRASWLNEKETDANESPKSAKQKRHPDRNMKTNL